MSQNKKPTLEELLKLKRTEKPSEADWVKFDADLRRKMLCQFVGKRTFSLSSLAAFSFKKAYMGVTALAFCAVAAASFYSGMFSSVEVADSSSAFVAKCTPLPNLAQNFANNVLDAESAATESPVVAPMSFSNPESVRYVSNPVSASNIAAF